MGHPFRPEEIRHNIAEQIIPPFWKNKITKPDRPRTRSHVAAEQNEQGTNKMELHDQVTKELDDIDLLPIPPSLLQPVNDEVFTGEDVPLQTEQTNTEHPITTKRVTFAPNVV
jgi:hypothetical protein